jgi:hypothetical protein
MTGEFYNPEVFGSGVALFDYDNDGDLDVYLVQGNFLDRRRLEEAIFPPHETPPLSDRLFRNELVGNDSGGLGFVDVTAVSEIQSKGYGMGVAVGDYDNDGWLDLYVTAVGSNTLFHNEGNGIFRDVTSRAGAHDPRWSVPAIFFDYDRDGWLDLYVGNYVDFNLGTHKVCRTDTGEPDYCGPTSFRPEPDRLLRNRGDGTFEDATARAGIDREFGNTLGAIATDLNGDGWLDLYVGNDWMPNQMWINQGDGTFVNEALIGGSAVNKEGLAEASMGVDAADFDGDGDEDLIMTHLALETNTIFVNDGRAQFDDRSVQTGLGMPSWEWTGFGTAWVDYDNDGLLDVVVANGAIRKIERQARSGNPYPLAEPNLLFRNLGNRFEEVSHLAGEIFARLEVSRGAAFGDVDNDGDTDVVVNNNSGPVRLFRNNVGQESHWLGLELSGNPSRHSVLGARVAVRLESGAILWRRVKVAGSYASASDPRVLVGLGGNRAVSSVLVEWPDGSAEVFTEVTVDSYNLLQKGTGSSKQ